MNSITPIAAANTIAIITIVAAIVILGTAIIVLALIWQLVKLWIRAKLTRANVTMLDLIGMKFRRIDADTLVRSKITATQAGLDDPEMTTKALEAHYMARGNVPQVVRALIAARKSRKIDLSFLQAAAIDLAGRDVLEAVQTSVYPRVLLRIRSMRLQRMVSNCESKYV
jgi:uncharacterized protein YqfA (UPF0365 family)